MLSEVEAKELLSFLTLDTRPEVKGQATEYFLGLSGNRDGCRYLQTKPDFLKALVTLTTDPSIAIVKDCYHSLINLSADETMHQPLIKDSDFLPILFKNLLDPEFMFADRICTILTNLSRHVKTCKEVFKAMQEQEIGLAQIVDIFCTEGYNKQASLHYLGPLLSNLTQLPETRHFILDKERCVVQRLLPYTKYQASTIRRGGVIGTLRNCCFDHAHHEWLLSDAVDILPFLLLPLAGPEELSDEENEGLPVDLQYLPEDKEREEDPDIRKMLIETMILLTATKVGRQILKAKNVYAIMREFHNWEKEPHVAAACEKLIQVHFNYTYAQRQPRNLKDLEKVYMEEWAKIPAAVLIGDEPEPDMENLLEVEIPEDVEVKLKDMDAKEQEQLEKEQEDLLNPDKSQQCAGIVRMM